jgi:hypothetical protein
MVLSGVSTKLVISMKIEIYSYTMAHRCAFCSSETLYKDCGALMCYTHS